MSYKQVYRQLFIELRKKLTDASLAQVRNQALLTQALGYSSNCHLATLATLLLVPGQRENLVQRIRRWLANPATTQQRCYMPLVNQLFAQWSRVEVGLVLDRTDIEDQRSILMLAVAAQHRALPLAWRILPFGATGAESQIALLKQVRPYLPQQARITLYGDSEFRAVKVQRYCRTQRWHWHLGLNSDILFRQGDEGWRPLQAITVTRGQRRYVQKVLLTKEHVFGPVNLIADWTRNTDTPRYFALDQRADRHSWRRGRKRFWIEPLFRDWKSYGFDLEKNKLVHARRLEALLIALATATLWMIHVGQWVIKTDRRVLLEARHKHDYSIFRLGRDYTLRSQFMNWPLPVGFTVSG